MLYQLTWHDNSLHTSMPTLHVLTMLHGNITQSIRCFAGIIPSTLVSLIIVRTLRFTEDYDTCLDAFVRCFASVP